ncbi:MAG: B12-binding domain-containing radical SAM protein [Treponema sp.]|jgi:radical SAM superfamily enzyme YgiQ (UPF0313 family)|nr:B12-binding domain-containing radical SAM protein [Treponema sp.]
MSEPAHGGILLAAINAKWIHPSLALRLLKTNLGPLEKDCAIIEFALRQPLREKTNPILAAQPRIFGLSVSIWNHTATLELLKELHQTWETEQRPLVVLGGPEVSYLPPEAEIFRYADYCIVGEGEIAFRELCETIFNYEDSHIEKNSGVKTIFVNREFQQVNVTAIKSAYHLYTDEDVRKKLVYVEASRGCPFGCEFCLSAQSNKVREFPLEPFLAEMDDLIRRGAKTFKFLDRSFNLNIERARQIMEFFLNKIEERAEPFVVHFEMISSRFPPELIETIARFPPGTLRLEIGIQTLNPDVAARIGRPSEPERELAAITLLREKTHAIIHADLIAGLPGEDMASFGRGFDLLWAALSSLFTDGGSFTEIQLGILKLLPGTAIVRHNAAYGMCYNSLPPYEVMETAAMPAGDLDRLKNFARFWELIVNRGLINIRQHCGNSPVFNQFMTLADSLLARFGRNWGIDKKELHEAVAAFFALTST